MANDRVFLVCTACKAAIGLCNYYPTKRTGFGYDGPVGDFVFDHIWSCVFDGEDSGPMFLPGTGADLPFALVTEQEEGFRYEDYTWPVHEDEDEEESA